MSGGRSESLPDVQEMSGVPHGCLGVVMRPSWMSGCGPESLLEVREAPGEIPGVVGRPFRMYGSGRETLPDVRK